MCLQVTSQPPPPNLHSSSRQIDVVSCRLPNASFVQPLTTAMKFRTVTVSPSPTSTMKQTILIPWYGGVIFLQTDISHVEHLTKSLDTRHHYPRVSHDTLLDPNPQTHLRYCQRDKQLRTQHTAQENETPRETSRQ